MRTKFVILPMMLLTLSACGADSDNLEDEKDAQSTQEADEKTFAPARTVTPRPTPTPAPIPTQLIGDEVTLTDAKVTILTVEKVEEIPTDQYADTLTPADGESLHYLTWEWTNLSNEAGWGICFGPNDSYLTLYDQNDREMARHPDWIYAAGNDCENDVLTGQGGVIYDAYRGLADSEVTYMTLVNHSNNTREIIVVDPSIEIYED